MPTIADFVRLDPRFQLPAGTWDRLPQYRDWGFAVFKLKPGRHTFHPMAFEFVRRNPRQLFFPTVHIHDGKVHKTAHLDHTLFCQHYTAEKLPLGSWTESPQPASQFILDATLHHGVVHRHKHVYGLRLDGPTEEPGHRPQLLERAPMRRTVLLLVTALCAGCAGPGGGAGTLPQGPLPSPSPSVGTSPAPQPRGTGTVTVQLTAGTLTGASFSFAGYDSAGRTIYGPLPRERSDSIVIPDVPVNAATLGIAVLTGNTTIGVGQAPLTLATTVTQTIRDPEIQPLTTLVGLDLQPQALKIAFGTAGQLTATGRFNNGRSVLMSAAVNWLSLDQFIVPVTPTGEAEGAGEGGVTVIASAGVVNATARVQVTGVRLEAINIAPPTVRLSSLANTTLTATGSFSDGTTQDLTTLVQWTSKRPEVASVSPSGLVVGLSEGETTIEAVGGPVTAVARALVGR